MMLLEQDVRCPFCFKSFSAQRIRFRCIRPGCPGWTDDHLYAKARGLPQAPKMGFVFEAEQGDDKRRLPVGVLRSALCKQCFNESYTHLCPECHFELSHDVGQVKQRIIAVIGGRGTGKSHFIGSLIFAMRHEAGTNIDFTTRLLGDETQKRWEADFYNPVFVHRRILKMTVPAATDAKVRAPLVLRLTSKSSLLMELLSPILQLMPQDIFPKRVVNTSIFDSSGEDLTSFQSVSVHVRSILHADGIILVVDPMQIDNVRQQLQGRGISLPTPVPGSHPDDILGRLLQLFEEQGNVRPGGKIPVPIAIVLSKADTLTPILDRSSALLRPGAHYRWLNLAEIQAVSTEVSQYLRRWLTPSFCDTIEQRFASYHYFGVSALGKDQDVSGQLEVIEPLRVEEPFLWLLYKKGFVRGK